jgi:hypothetical protein
MASSSGGILDTNKQQQLIAIDFQKELNQILESKPPVSKEKINRIVKVALKEIRNYKHVVYYVESFIKNVSNLSILYIYIYIYLTIHLIHNYLNSVLKNTKFLVYM